VKEEQGNCLLEWGTLDIALEIVTASDATERKAHKLAAMLRDASEGLKAASYVTSINLVTPDREQGSTALIGIGQDDIVNIDGDARPSFRSYIFLNGVHGARGQKCSVDRYSPDRSSDWHHVEEKRGGGANRLRRPLRTLNNSNQQRELAVGKTKKGRASHAIDSARCGIDYRR
jgi:hypothetical protein